MAINITADQILEGDVVRVTPTGPAGQIQTKSTTHWLENVPMIRLTANAWEDDGVDSIECYPKANVTLLYRDKAAREATGIHPGQGPLSGARQANPAAH